MLLAFHRIQLDIPPAIEMPSVRVHMGLPKVRVIWQSSCEVDITIRSFWCVDRPQYWSRSNATNYYSHSQVKSGRFSRFYAIWIETERYCPKFLRQKRKSQITNKSSKFAAVKLFRHVSWPLSIQYSLELHMQTRHALLHTPVPAGSKYILKPLFVSKTLQKFIVSLKSCGKKNTLLVRVKQLRLASVGALRFDHLHTTHLISHSVSAWYCGHLLMCCSLNYALITLSQSEVRPS